MYVLSHLVRREKITEAKNREKESDVNLIAVVAKVRPVFFSFFHLRVNENASNMNFYIETKENVFFIVDVAFVVLVAVHMYEANERRRSYLTKEGHGVTVE
jgi:hypothetical protein